VEDYVDEAVRHGHVWSSISEALRDAKKAADRARVYSIAGIVALIGLGLSVMGVAYAVLSDQHSLPRKEDLQRSDKSIASLQSQVRALRVRVKTLEARKTGKPAVRKKK
jgi:hypothetical protein